MRFELKILACVCLLTLLAGCGEDMAVRKKRAEALEGLGATHVREGDFQKGIKELLQAAELDPENHEIQNTIGEAYQRLVDTDKAVLHYQNALKLKPGYPEAQNNLGTVYIMLGQWDKATQLFSAAAENNMYTTRHVAYNNMGIVSHEKGDYRKAIEYYKKAVGLFPTYSPAHDNMGLAYEGLKEWDLAIEAYKRSIEHAFDFPLSHLRLGSLYLRLDRHKEAEEELLLAIKTDKSGEYAKEARALLEKVKVGR